MHKILVVLLAVCLVSVLAGITKRDVEDPNNLLDQIKKNAEELGKKFSEALNPESIKEGFNNVVDTISKAAQEFKPKEEAKQ